MATKGGVAKAINLARANLARKRRPSRVRYEPTSVQIEITNHCNLLCIHCGRTNLSTLDSVGTMTLEQFQHVFSQFPYLKSVSLFGDGESLLSPHLFDIIDWIREDRGPRFRISLTTNGVLLKQDKVDKFVESGVRLTVSLDATTPEVYEACVVAKSFHKVVEGMERLKEAADTSGYRWTLNFVIMNENVSQIVDIVDLAKKYGARKLNLGEQNFQRAGGRMDDAFIQHRDTVRKNVTRALARGKEIGIDVKFNRRDQAVWPEHDTFVPCKYLWNLPFISWNGFVCLCCSRPDPKDQSFGNLFEKSFQEIWFGEEYARFREQVREGTQATVCKGCQHLRPDADAILQLDSAGDLKLFRDRSRRKKKNKKAASSLQSSG
ncbi:MAG: radical SAM protein [Planctomycetota bacterium]|jgi:radical SAM protein with 4Fe4S-binding SPASM domain